MIAMMGYFYKNNDHIGYPRMIIGLINLINLLNYLAHWKWKAISHLFVLALIARNDTLYGNRFGNKYKAS